MTKPGSNGFIEDEGFGTLVSHDDADRIREGIARWLGLDSAQRAAFSTRAADYTANHLSLDAAMSTRLALWDPLIP